MLPSIMSSEQTASIEKQFTGESGRLISDIILNITNHLNIKSFLVKMHLGKAFDALVHSFVVPVFLKKKLNLGKILIDWIKIL